MRPATIFLIICMDFTKGFDKVAHQRLLSKMDGYREESSWADVLSVYHKEV